MKVRVIATLVTALCLAVGSASASSIGVFFAADASDCDGVTPAFTPTNVYIIALLGGDGLAGGMTGAEFRMDGLPSSGFANSATANPASNIQLGNPLTGGVSMAFPTCQSGPRVLLYTVQIVPFSPQSEMYFTINQHTTPTSPSFPCPWMTDCSPNFVIFCVPGGQAIANGRPCTVGVEQTSWSKVKGLYSN